MTQASLAELFQTSIANISMHIRNIYKEGELMEEATSKPDLLVRNEGSRAVKRTTKLYNLKMIIAIGMRAKSSAATSFRIWASNVLREYMVKGFAMDDRRLEDPELYLAKGGKIIPAPYETLKDLVNEGLIYLCEYVGYKSAIIKLCGASLAILNLAVNQVDYRWIE